MIDQEADAILSAHTNRPLSLCKYCRSGEHRKGKYGCLSWADCECQTCMEEPQCTVALNADKPATAEGISMIANSMGANRSVAITSAKIANPIGPMKNKEPHMSATPPAVRATDLEKRLEGLTPEDLQTAMEMARQAAPLLSKLVDENTVITLYQEEKITDWMHDADRIYKSLWAIDTPDVQKAFELHRSLTAKRERRGDFFKQIVAKCKTLIGRRKLAEDRRLADERREKERLAREEAERQRQAEIDAQLAAAAEAEKVGDTEVAALHMEEAKAVEEAPAIPVVVPEVMVPKVDGSSVSFKLVGKVKDPARFVCELLGIEYADAIATRANLLNEAIASWSQSGINAQLKRGLTFSPEALEVTKEPIVRNLGRK